MTFKSIYFFSFGELIFLKIYYRYRALKSIIPRMVSWLPPLLGCVCLNVDDSAITISGVAEHGGLIRDSSGNFIRGFHGSLGVTDVTHAEIMGIFQGISICWDMGVTRLVCYSNSSLTLKFI